MDWSNCYSLSHYSLSVPQLAAAFCSPSEGQSRSFVQGSCQGSQRATGRKLQCCWRPSKITGTYVEKKYVDFQKTHREVAVPFACVHAHTFTGN